MVEQRGYKFMVETFTSNPREWSTQANIIPTDLSDLANTTPFTGTDCTLSIEGVETIDGHSLKKLKIDASW